MIPKISFVYSSVYDRRCKRAFEEKFPKEKYPDGKYILKYMKIVEKRWRAEEKRVLRGISSISGLQWHENIKCYVVGRIIPFSDPLTMKVYADKDRFMDTLVHELIHNILTQNFSILKKYFISLKKKYEKESLITRNHILVHAIHEEIYLKIFNKARLKKDIASSSKDRDYKRSWDIVLTEEGAVLKDLKKYTRR